MSSAVFACTAAFQFSLCHDLENKTIRVRLYGSARDMLVSRIFGVFSRVITAFPFLSQAFTVDSLQFSSCALSPQILFPLRGLLDCASSGAPFHYGTGSIPAEELVAALGNSHRDMPWIRICIVYTPATLPFARALCETLSCARVGRLSIHCFMARAVPFMVSDAEFRDDINRADHLVVLARLQELLDALCSPPHSVVVSQLLKLHRLLMQSPNTSFSSLIIGDDSASMSSACNPHSALIDNRSTFLLSSAIRSSSCAAPSVPESLARIFLGSEQLCEQLLKCSSSDAPLQPSRVHAVSAAVLDLLSELELRLTQDANVLQQEFSTVSLGSDSALHISSSAELEVSAQTFSNASPDSPAPRDKYRSTKCADNHSDGSFIGAMEDTYISDRNGYDEDDGGLPEHSHPQPPTPPNDDDILELESLILSLNSSPVSRPPVDVSVSETSSIALSSHEDVRHPPPSTSARELSLVSAAAPHQRAPPLQSADDVEVATPSANSASAPQEFLKKGTNSMRIKQRRSKVDGTRQKSIADQESKDNTPGNAISSFTSLSPVRSSPSSKSPYAGLSSPDVNSLNRSLAHANSSDAYPPDAHPRLALLLPELCFDRSPGAAHRLIGSWIDEGRASSSLSSAMRLVCLCEMHIGRPYGPSSSPLILWHRCCHQGFRVAAHKGTALQPRVTHLPCRLSHLSSSFEPFPLLCQLPRLFVPALKHLVRSSRLPALPVSATAFSAPSSMRKSLNATCQNGITPTCACCSAVVAAKQGPPAVQPPPRHPVLLHRAQTYRPRPLLLI
jgi:hypothetical protein